jgi:hypothetical protein
MQEIRNFINLKKINEKPSTHIIPNGESTNNFPLKLATRQG